MRHIVFFVLSVALAQLAAAGQTLPEGPRFPVQRFDIADGLPHSIVRSLLVDREGFLWVGTDEGLSRFDGYEFRSFVDDFGTPYINAVAQSGDGSIWIGTNGGGAASIAPSGLFGRAPEPLRVHMDGLVGLAASNINRLLVDDRGRVWCATDDGLYRSTAVADGGIRFERVDPGLDSGRYEVRQLLTVGDGHVLAAIWSANAWEVVAFDAESAGGVAARVDRIVGAQVSGAVAEPGGALLVVNDDVVRYRRDATGWSRAVAATGLPQSGARTSMLVDRLGRLWVGTVSGLFRLDTDRWTPVALPVRSAAVLDLAEQADGTIWIGSDHGLLRLLPHAIATWTSLEGLGDGGSWEVVNDRGRVVIVGRTAMFEVRDERIRSIGPLPASFLGGAVRFRRTRDGVGWLVSGGTVQEAWPDGPGQDVVFAHGAPEGTRGWVLTAVQSDTPFVDDGGRTWLSTGDTLYFREPGARPGSRWSRSPIVLAPHGGKVAYQDAGGRLWVAGNLTLGVVEGDVLRPLRITDGLPELQPRAVFEDSRGWLWIGLRNRGLSFTRDPAAGEPIFENYSTRTGLSSNTVWAICEDLEGRMYLGTGRGLDRLDPRSGRVRHFTSVDGLAADLVRSCATDALGHVWIGTQSGVSRIDPTSVDTESAPPPVVFTKVQAAGLDLLSAGQYVDLIDGVALDSQRHNLRVDFLALNLRGERLLYQYRLGDADWSVPSALRSVNYARLAPGDYRLEVRALTPEGVASPRPAAMVFTVEAPFWQRPWVLLLVAGMVGAGAFVRLRVRSARALALEQVRRRIAVDLHDDLGAGLVQVAVLSEVARRDAASSESAGTLEAIGSLARDMRASLGDIVWSIDPRRDYLGELIVRVREMATNSLDAHAVAVTFRSPAGSDRIPLPPDHRRQLLLFCKEALANVARHAGATAVAVEFTLEGAWLSVTVTDDGVGLPPDAMSRGQGLGSLRERIERLGGRLDVTSDRGQGVRLHARVPLPH